MTTKKIILLLMVRNEALIIRRCIERALAAPDNTLVDAICLCDTGSDDTTLAEVAAITLSIAVPLRVFSHTWKNFGYNRSLSFDACRDFCNDLAWPLESTYALVLDADMNLVMDGGIDKNTLHCKGYTLEQRNGSVQYRNTRLLQLSVPWRCLGVTHEYWDGAHSEPINGLWINDVGDGGCKADKFERDERLLSAGLLEDPSNVRYMFYLAQTLKDVKRLPEAIAMYKRRVRAGGWFQEKYYSAYQISRIYRELGDLVRMEYWGLRAAEIDRERAESLYFLTQIFREVSQHHKAWHYMQLGMGIGKPTDKLFLEGDVYEHKFLYEKTVLNYYVQPLRRPDSLRDLVSYCNRFGDLAYSNLLHYVDAVPGVLWRRELQLPELEGGYVATSTSFRGLKDPEENQEHYLLNVRYVNYRIRADGSYAVLGPRVHTRNVAYRATADFCVLNEPIEMHFEMQTPLNPNTSIAGIEDLRLGAGPNDPWFGASMEYNAAGNIQQVMGYYDTENGRLWGIQEIKSPQQSSCEKNWVSLPDGSVVYRWHPYEVGRLDNAQLIIDHARTQQTPGFFAHVRGSSNVVRHGNLLYCVVHVVQHTTPRKYYHLVVRMDAETMVLRDATNPFFFFKNAIEYVLACDVVDQQLVTVVSQNDANPVAIAIDLGALTFYPIL